MDFKVADFRGVDVSTISSFDADGELEPIPYNIKETKKRIAIVDTETDPFEHGLVVKPFSVGFLTSDRYVEFWGDDCVTQFFDYLATLDDEFIIYAHNGGKFDFFFMLQYLDEGQSPLIMNGRITKATFQGQEFRDSFAIIPQGLATYQKDKIDYNRLKRGRREKHRAEILAYQKTDCQYLWDLVVEFHNMFGDKLTVASAALPMLNSFSAFERMKSDSLDERFRSYYYGGRVQCFETGVLRGDFKIYDRNSMYPAVMRDTLHPISAKASSSNRITAHTDFARIIAKNDNCLPVRSQFGSLDFSCKHGEFYATIHEINAGLETGTLEIEKVIEAWTFEQKASFGEFVDHFYNLRMMAKVDGDKIRDILYKLILNSAYGKFALNPRKFKQWTFSIDTMPDNMASQDNPDGWTLHSRNQSIFIWERPAPRKTGFYNVATAASITGAARANLHLNLAQSTRPIYCDTDSIICESFNGDFGNELGQWKLEGKGTLCAIAGKKLYAILDGYDAIKIASKGSKLTATEIIRVAEGEIINYKHAPPNFKLDGTAKFVTRNIKRTGT